jgi:hypothetical protein
VLRRCLEKDPKRRLRDVGDVQLALGGAFDAPVATAIAPAPTRSTTRRVLAIAAGAALLGAVVAGGLTWRFLRDDGPTLHPVRFPMIGPSLFSTNASFRQIAVSPDGTHIAWISASDGGAQLMVRAVGELEARPLRGAGGAGFPFFLPTAGGLGTS